MKIGGIPPLQKLARYKLELAEAVKKEEYEKAARLRDRIQDLKQRIACPADKANRSSGLA